MELLFDKEWNKETIKDIVKKNRYLKFGDHEDLKALCICPFALDEEFYNPDYDEILYVVPTNWLKEVAKREFEIEDLDNWLRHEYTSDESEIIFEIALNERQVVMIDFN